MIEAPCLETPRLRVRPVAASDVAAIQAAAGDAQIADTMISLPHPYPAGEAERLVARSMADREVGRGVTFVLEQATDGGFRGCIELRAIEWEHAQAEVSFWLIPAAWSQGQMGEALHAVLGYAFDGLGLNRVYAHHMVRNPACGRVLERNGFRREGRLRERVRKHGRPENVFLWAILAKDWRATPGIRIFRAVEEDRVVIAELVTAAFGPDEGPEISTLVAALEADPTARPVVSLVARSDATVVGHILFTAALLDPPAQGIFAAILAPLSVAPGFQSKGIGGSLISEGLLVLAEAGVDLVFVLGHPGYYPRHGFAPAGVRGLEAPYPIPDEVADAWMVLALRPGILDRVRGRVVCADALDDPTFWRE